MEQIPRPRDVIHSSPLEPLPTASVPHSPQSQNPPAAPHPSKDAASALLRNHLRCLLTRNQRTYLVWEGRHRKPVSIRKEDQDLPFRTLKEENLCPPPSLSLKIQQPVSALASGIPEPLAPKGFISPHTKAAHI